VGDSVFMDILEQIDDLSDIKDFSVLIEFLDIGFDEVDELASFAIF